MTDTKSANAGNDPASIKKELEQVSDAHNDLPFDVVMALTRGICACVLWGEDRSELKQLRREVAGLRECLTELHDELECDCSECYTKRGLHHHDCMAYLQNTIRDALSRAEDKPPTIMEEMKRLGVSEPTEEEKFIRREEAKRRRALRRLRAEEVEG